ncbi:hypothetical protein SCLCIDRAFT_1217440 [Scleroderma citrinum Foug A]|uniref:DNAJ-containing protein X-domain domain-containing protein n=1 Tax=Scleroderma citrinum Foug A TaxID=1036808 RepID=A0A0C3DUF1_9AGAM|nr:hypothetical protein SCLCIDRAFT_1217440 [Scleroderma citrinum Foug A]
MLQVMHDAMQDDSERRALEEDITGKILWTCWRGIALEIQHVVENVTDRIQMMDDVALETRAHCLWDIGQVFKQTLPEPPDDGRAHLRRIMADAKADTSKYQLIRSARRAGGGVGRETSEESR